ncbi:ty3-gypsy retrotransposon protein [Tanacetum coccineum]
MKWPAASLPTADFSVHGLAWPVADLSGRRLAWHLVEAVQATWFSDPTLQTVIEGMPQGTAENSKYTWSANELRRKGKLVATMKRLAAYFYWKGLKKIVKQQIHLCDACQRNKSDFLAYPGLLLPLRFLKRLGKYAHSLTLSHSFTAAQVSQAFLDSVYKLHGLPSTIMSDRDKVFLSLFWKSLFKMLKVQLCMSTSYHPQSDSQTKAANKCLETYLRCMTGEKPKEWMKWLPLAEYWYNTNFYNSIKTTPFEAREQVISMLKFHLKVAQDRMKVYVDKKISDREFVVGDLVYLNLKPYRLLTIRVNKQHKLSAKFYGHFKVLQKIGKVAYNLELPSTTQGSLVVVPYKLLVYGLVQWSNETVEDATWELLTYIGKRFPDFDIDH